MKLVDLDFELVRDEFPERWARADVDVAWIEAVGDAYHVRLPHADVHAVWIFAYGEGYRGRCDCDGFAFHTTDGKGPCAHLCVLGKLAAIDEVHVPELRPNYDCPHCGGRLEPAEDDDVDWTCARCGESIRERAESDVDVDDDGDDGAWPSVTVRMPEEWIEEIDELVARGAFDTRSAAIRDSLARFGGEDRPALPTCLTCGDPIPPEMLEADDRFCSAECIDDHMEAIVAAYRSFYGADGLTVATAVAVGALGHAIRAIEQIDWRHVEGMTPVEGEAIAGRLAEVQEATKAAATEVPADG